MSQVRYSGTPIEQDEGACLCRIIQWHSSGALRFHRMDLQGQGAWWYWRRSLRRRRAQVDSRRRSLRYRRRGGGEPGVHSSQSRGRSGVLVEPARRLWEEKVLPVRPKAGDENRGAADREMLDDRIALEEDRGKNRARRSGGEKILGPRAMRRAGDYRKVAAFARPNGANCRNPLRDTRPPALSRGFHPARSLRPDATARPRRWPVDPSTDYRRVATTPQTRPASPLPSDSRQGDFPLDRRRTSRSPWG